MKILWFANTPGRANEVLNNRLYGGGWIEALQCELESLPGHELGLCFYADAHLEPFRHGPTQYFPIRRKLNSKLKRLYARLVSEVEYDENLPSFLAAIEAFRPDIIHVHGTESSFGLIAKEITGIPVVVSIQGNLTVYARKYFAGIGRQEAGGYWKIMNKVLQQHKSFVNRASIEAEILSHTKYVLGRTAWDRRVSRVMAPEAAYYHVDEVLNPAFYAKRWKKNGHAGPVFFTTTSGSLYKGFEVIIETACELKKLKRPFQWQVAGLDEKEALVQTAMRLKNVNDLEAIGIRLLGRLASPALLEHMLHADIYVQVSHIENSPNSLCEAMLVGMPVVASYAGGTASLVRDDESGILVQDGDALSLAGALIELSADGALAERLGEAAHKTARTRHDPAGITRQLISAYTAVIKKHQAKHP